MIGPGGERLMLHQFVAGAKLDDRVSVVDCNNLDDRIDGEYYQPHLLRYEDAINRTGWTITTIGHLVKDGYRVVYTNTKILTDDFHSQKHVKFLQAADILEAYPTINQSSIGWVSIDDWYEYPNGRIRHGEILIEVKGKAEKVVMVPDDFPEDALVTGTLYKMLIDEEKANRHYVFVYLLSRLGRDFRDRGKTNTLISYVNKNDLYSIPIPLPSREIQNQIEELYRRSYKQYRHSLNLYSEAESLLLSALGLDTLDLSPQLSYTAMFDEVGEEFRLDAEYFQPKYRHILEVIEGLKPKAIKPLGELLKILTNGHTPRYHNLSIGNVVFLTAEHVYDFRIDFDSDKRIEKEHHDNLLNRTRLQNGDMLLTIKGRIGNVAIVEHLPRPTNINQDVALLRLKPDYHPYYVMGYLNSLAGKMLIEQASTGQINPFLRLGSVAQISVPIFDKSLMDELGEQVKSTVQNAYAAQKEAKQLLEMAKQRVEEMILGQE